jgi:HD-GYP domain-containing protein (c-di-GMP phosphodiesterase class II)
LFGLLAALSELSDRTFAHAIATSALSVMIGKAQNWTKPATFEKLALGGLLRDIGLKELPAGLLNKPRSEMTAEDVAMYETHPYRGMEILRSIANASDDVIAIVYEHEENAIGQGYPRRLRDLRINPLAKVVALADTFARLTMRLDGPRPALAPEAAIDHIDSVMGQPFNREAFTALKLIVKKDHKATA